MTLLSDGDAQPQPPDAAVERLVADAIERSTSSTELSSQQNIDEIRAHLEEHSSDLLSAVATELSAWRKSRRPARALPAQRRTTLLLFFLAAAAVCLVVAISCLLNAIFKWSWLLTIPLIDNKPLVESALSFGAVILLLIAAFFTIDTDTPSRSATARGDESLLRDALQREASGMATSYINELSRRSSTEIESLSTEEAPRLVELNAVDAVESATVRACRDFIRSHQTSAIGISGPRGVGKTTVMQHICRLDAEDYLGVYVSSPVAYSSTDFVRLLHAAVAEQVLGGADSAQLFGRGALARSESRIFMVRLLMASALIGVGLATVVVGRVDVMKLRPSDIVGAALIAFGVSGLLLGALTSVRRTVRRAGNGKDVLSLARLELERLRFTYTTQTSSRNALQFRGLSAEDQEQYERAERERSHPELVADFRRFLSELTGSINKSVIIAVDELDKLNNANDALAVVNGMKDLLHGSRTHFLVSVSEEALTSFALRGISLRDAFDSSFDAVLPVARLTADESIELLSRRVVHFPVELSLFCHALGGGLPRDSIRVARNCVEVRRTQTSDVPLHQLIPTVVRRHVLELLDGAVARSAVDSKGDVAKYLRFRRIVQEVQPESLAGSLEDMARRVVDERSATIYAPEYNLAILILALSTACHIFSLPYTRAEWLEYRERGASTECAEYIAKAVAVLALDGETALFFLNEARQLAELSSYRLAAHPVNGVATVP